MNVSPEAWAVIGVGITTTGAVVIGFFRQQQGTDRIGADATPDRSCSRGH